MQLMSSIKVRAGVFEALQYRDFRLFWIGQVIGVLGFQMLIISQGWLIYDLTGSKIQLGLVGLSAAVPAILLNLFGGVVADKINPKLLIMGTQSMAGLTVTVLATLVLTHLIQPWHVMAGAFAWGALGAFDQPSRQAMFPHLIDRRSMMNAVALNSMVWQSTRIVGPAMAGIFIDWFGAALTYYLAGAGFFIFVLFLAAVRMPRIVRTRSSSFFRDLMAGVIYVRNNHIFTFLLGMTFFNSFFGLSYIQLMPVFQKDILQVGASGLGVLMAASGVGALTGTLVIASLGNVKQRGKIIIGGAIAFGLLLTLFGYSHWLPVSLVLVALAGGASSIYMILAQSTLQVLVPDEFRGRVMGFWGMTFNIMPLGGFQAGILANYFGAPLTVALGGTAVIAFALLGAARDPEVRRLGTLTTGS